MALQDSPGPSVVNAAEVLSERIATVFGGPCRLFAISPGTEATWIEVLWQTGQAKVTFRADVPHPRCSGSPGRR